MSRSQAAPISGSGNAAVPPDDLRGASLRFALDPTTPLPHAGGGLAAMAVADRAAGRRDLMAVAVDPAAPPRALAVLNLSSEPVEGVLNPLAGELLAKPDGQIGQFVICEAADPPQPVWLPGAEAGTPWTEAELLDDLLRPAAAALAALEARGLTHRAIRPGNIFRRASGHRVALGCAWAAPPAMHQPAAFEPPYSGMCVPAGRGEGGIADDVYALGVTMLALALGTMPLAGQPPEQVIWRKLRLGSFAALAGEARLPGVIADLVRAMLAPDPEHRPPPGLLTNPMAARARRVAARPAQRAQRPLEVAAGPVWDARALAYALASDGKQAMHLLQSGELDRWLRRSLGASDLAGSVDQAVRQRIADGITDPAASEPRLLMRVIAILDPLAPLHWRGLSLWPDGIGPLLVAASPPAEGSDAQAAFIAQRVEQIVATEAIAVWAVARGARGDVSRARADARLLRSLHRQKGWSGGLPRLRYALNRLLPCRAAAVRGVPIATPAELLPLLERQAQAPGSGAPPPVDRDLTAFLAARLDGSLDGLAGPAGDGAGAGVLGQLRVLAALQKRLRAAPVPALAKRLAEAAGPTFERWRKQSRRSERQQAAVRAAESGMLPDLLAVLDDPTALVADAAEARQAAAAVRRIEAELAALAEAAPSRARLARETAQTLAAALSFAACAAGVVAALVGA